MISVITPAHNEEGFIGGCLRSVRVASSRTAESVEHLVVLNRCTDRTAHIAQAHGAKTIIEDARNLSRIRNAGSAAANGDILITIDADSRMSPNMLTEVISRLGSEKTIGGGVRIRPERMSPGIFCSLLVVLPFVLWHGVSAGMFWCRRRDYEAIGGFDESLASIEDIDLGKRLKAHGRRLGKTYQTIRRAHIVTSCRKFDQFGDWYFVKNPAIVIKIFRRDQTAADEFYYDAR